jgi:hypothetical protein
VTCWHIPSGDPGREGRPSLAGESRAPVVKAAGGREGGADLGHGEPDGHGEGAGDEPAEGHGDRAAELEPCVVERGDPREHGDDGEGEGEVGQHPARRSCDDEPDMHGRSGTERSRDERGTYERSRLSSCLYPSSRRRASPVSSEALPPTATASSARDLFHVMMARGVRVRVNLLCWPCSFGAGGEWRRRQEEGRGGGT